MRWTTAARSSARPRPGSPTWPRLTPSSGRRCAGQLGAAQDRAVATEQMISSRGRSGRSRVGDDEPLSAGRPRASASLGGTRPRSRRPQPPAACRCAPATRARARPVCVTISRGAAVRGRVGHRGQRRRRHRRVPHRTYSTFPTPRPRAAGHHPVRRPAAGQLGPVPPAADGPLAPLLRGATTPPLPSRLPADLELRLDHQHQVAVRPDDTTAPEARRVREMNERSATTRSNRPADVRRVKGAHVGPPHLDPWVVRGRRASWP